MKIIANANTMFLFLGYVLYVGGDIIFLLLLVFLTVICSLSSDELIYEISEKIFGLLLG